MKIGYTYSLYIGTSFCAPPTQSRLTCTTRAEEFGQNYVRSAATSVDKLTISTQYSYIVFALKALKLKAKFQRIQRKIM